MLQDERRRKNVNEKSVKFIFPRQRSKTGEIYLMAPGQLHCWNQNRTLGRHM